MPVRLTGMVSGMDTDTLIQQLVAAKQTKIDDVKGQKTKLEWQKEAWADMNKKVYSFYTGTLSKIKSQSTYKTKKAISTDDSKVEVKANANAVVGSHSIEVQSVASSTYLTSGKLKTTGFQESYSKAVTDTNKKLSEMNNASELVGKELTIKVGDGDDAKTMTYEFSADSTIADLQNKIQNELGDGIEVSLKDGKLSIANKTATATTGDDGETLYNGGSMVSISGEALGFFGVTGDDVTLTAESADDGNHSLTVGTALTERATRTINQITGSSRVTEALGIDAGSKITVNIGGADKEITIDSDTTMSQLAEKFSATGINATYDANQGRFFLSSKSAGEENIFTLSGDTDALNKLKLNKDADVTNVPEEERASYVKGSSAVILYNGAYIKSNSNEMTVNGLSITVKDQTTQKVNITVNNDTQAVYDSVKEFVTEYNKLMTDMYEKYSAESSRGYDPLTDDQKEAMSEKEVENWEKKIKDSLLRRDDTLNSLMSSMRTTMMKSVEVTLKDGTKTKLSLSSIGIVTGNYTEHGLLHIKGDADDPTYSVENNKLKEWLENDPEAVMQLLAGVQNETTGQQEGLGNTLYSDFNTKMRSSTLSSALTFYNDKYMDKQIKSYQEKIDELEDKLVELEDSYYKKFAAMETALSKINSQSTYLTNLFGGGIA